MGSIYRLQLEVQDYQEIDITGPAISVAAARSGSSDVIDLWYEHNVSAPTTVGLYIFGTGHRTPWTVYSRANWRFVGTVTPSGLVWHVYTGIRQGEPIPS
ncbi:DUF7352 domain-containing protein [Mycolicibacterium sp. A43C]